MMKTEKRVFEVLLTEDNYDKNIKYTDDFIWQDSDKKSIQSLIWSQVLNSTDLEGQVTVDTAHGKLLIRFKTYPPDSPKRRFKQVEGFLLQEVPSIPQEQSIPQVPEVTKLSTSEEVQVHEDVYLHPVQRFDMRIKNDVAFFNSFTEELKEIPNEEKLRKIVEFAQKHGFNFSEEELVAQIPKVAELATLVETQKSVFDPLTQEKVSYPIESTRYRIVLKNGKYVEEPGANRHEERGGQYQFYKGDKQVGFVLTSQIASMFWD